MPEGENVVRMNTKAIYTVHEKGKKFHFFSDYAGGFSYPFAVANFLHSLKYLINDPMSPKKDLCVSPLLDQMTGDYRFPEEAEGKELFSAVAEAQVLCAAAKNEVSFGIEIDMEQDTVTFHFREDCEELQDYNDIAFPRNGEPGEYGGTRFYYAADNLKIRDMMDGVDRPISAANEEAYGKMILKAVQRQNREQCESFIPQM